MGAAQATLANATQAVTGDTGNESSNSNSNANTKALNSLPPPKDETEAIARTLLLLSSKLYKEYHPKLNDVKLCQHISIALANKLDAFDTIKLKGLVTRQGRKEVTLKPVFVASTNNPNIRFEVDGTLDKLPDFFYNQYVSVPEGLDKRGKTMSVPYIAKFIGDLLMADKPLKNASRQGRPRQSGGDDPTSTLSNAFGEFKKAFDQVQGNKQAQRANINKPANRGQNQRNQKNRRNARNVPKEPKEPKELMEKPESPKEERAQEKAEEDARKVVLENVRKNIREAGDQVNNKARNVKPKPVEAPPGQKPEQKPEPKPEPKNNRKNNRKGMSKEQLCRYIAHHYMVRANLVAAIASALPLSNARPGFCMSRVNALERGQLCLPPDYESLYSMPPSQASKKLAPYIRNFSQSRCDEARGFYKRYGEAKMKEIQAGNTNLQQSYTKLVQAMKTRYMNSLKLLKEILEELLNNANLTNQDLKVLSIKTKETLDSMYADCQYDYVLGVITLLQIDYQLPRMTPDSQNNLVNALDDRAK